MGELTSTLQLNHTWRNGGLSVSLPGYWILLRCPLQTYLLAPPNAKRTHILSSMEAGLSLRAEKNLEDLLLSIAAGAPPKQYNATAAVDLSSAQNEVLRPELVRLLQSTIEDKATSKVH